MTTYVDSSALLKRYVEEHDSDVADRLLDADPVLVTSWITAVEVRRNLPRLVDPKYLPELRRQFETDLESFALIACTESTAKVAADIAETLGVRSLDAIHLASAQRLLIADLRFITFDFRQAQAARSLGMVVAGA
ncbi:MAG: type II toxin-antitoxin system VapC family toxin [Acidimicrobiia bacterium]